MTLESGAWNVWWMAIHRKVCKGDVGGSWVQSDVKRGDVPASDVSRVYNVVYGSLFSWNSKFETKRKNEIGHVVTHFHLGATGR